MGIGGTGETQPVTTKEQNEANDSKLNVAETKAVNSITTAEKSTINTVVDKKFPDAKKTNEKLKDLNYDPQQEATEQIQYQTDKLNVIAAISDRKLNTKYITDNVEYKKTVFLQEDSDQVKAYLVNYNLKIVKQNTLNGTNTPIINIDDFMEKYEKEKPEPKATIQMSAAPVANFSSDKIDQETSKFIELTPEQQANITEGIGEVVAAGQKINAFKLYGYADATHIGSEQYARTQFTKFRDTLIAKGMDEKNLPPAEAEYFKGIETMTPLQREDLFNKSWADSRAMMQIVFLPKEYIAYINNNTTSFPRILDPRPIGSADVGNKFTGGKIELEVTGKEKITKELTETKNDVLKMIDNRQVTYAYTDGKNYYPIGAINVSNSNGKLTISDDLPFNHEPSLLLDKTHPIDAAKKDKKAFFSDNKNINTLWVMINNPNGEHKDNLKEIDTRVTATGMKLIEGSDGIASFQKSLKEFRDASVGDQAKINYANNTIALLDVYKDVDAQLKAKTIIL